MADVQTPFAVKTKDSGDVVAKLVDSAGSNLLAISATGQFSVKTDADGDVVVKVSDGTDTLLIDGDGKVGVNTDADRVAGAAIGTDGLIMMGSDGTDARFLKVDAAGILQVSTEGATGTIIDSGVLTHGGDLAPGASGSSDTAFITTSTTGKVLRFVVSSSVPFKAILKTNANAGTLVDQRVVFGNAGETVELSIVDGAISVVSDGDDRFRVTVTNMDDVETATIYSSITWTEE